MLPLDPAPSDAVPSDNPGEETGTPAIPPDDSGGAAPSPAWESEQSDGGPADPEPDPPPASEPDTDPEPEPEPEPHLEPGLLAGECHETGPYRSGAEHLRDEFRRIDLLVRAAAIAWLEHTGQKLDESQWGLRKLGDRELKAYLRAPYPGPPSCHIASYVAAAQTLRKHIDARLRQKDAAVRRPLQLLRKRFALKAGGISSDALLVCLLAEISEPHRRLLALLQNDEEKSRPTAGVVHQIVSARWLPATGQLALAPPSLWEVLGAGAPLAAAGLVLVGDAATAAEPLPVRPVRLADRVADFLLGGRSLDPHLVGVARWMARGNDGLEYADLPKGEPLRAQLKRLRELACWWRAEQAKAPAPTVLLLHGPTGSGRERAAGGFCRHAGVRLLAVDVEAALRRDGDWAALVEAAYREARLEQTAVLWSRVDSLLEGEPARARWHYLVERAARHAGLTFLLSHTAWEPAGPHDGRSRYFFRVDFPPPGFELRLRLWARRLPDRKPDDPQLVGLANAFQLTEGQIDDALAAARSAALQRSPAEPRLSWPDLYEACRAQSARRLVSFAQRIVPRRDLSLDNLILPVASKRLLEELDFRIEHQQEVYGKEGFEQKLTLGRGTTVLFTGPSGTGKTLAASILASKRGVDLYKVDLAAVVSKYVGDTEKNLGRVFSDAQDANAFLFFDEADALFGKRGDVRDARDRWANCEVDYLLQRIEEYSGTVILATNLRQNIDEAFLRRLQTVVEFPYPDAEARARIFKVMFPDRVGKPGDADLARLGQQFPLSGGQIKNVVLDAAFRARKETACGSLAVTVKHLVVAIAREYQKMNKPITRGEFGREFYDAVIQAFEGKAPEAPRLAARRA
jgi:AAA+ superfamily predicted ATPase